MSLGKLFNEHKFVRRFAVFWAICLITIVVLRVTEPEAIKVIGGSGIATITIGVIGLLATVIGFYQWSRGREDR